MKPKTKGESQTASSSLEDAYKMALPKVVPLKPPARRLTSMDLISGNISERLKASAARIANSEIGRDFVRIVDEYKAAQSIVEQESPEGLSRQEAALMVAMQAKVERQAKQPRSQGGLKSVDARRNRIVHRNEAIKDFSVQSGLSGTALWTAARRAAREGRQFSFRGAESYFFRCADTVDVDHLEVHVLDANQSQYPNSRPLKLKAFINISAKKSGI